MSPAFLSFLDWVAHKAPFGPRSNINAAIPREVYVNFIERSGTSRKHGTVPGSTERLVKALTGPSPGPFRSLLSALGVRSNGQPKYLVLVAVEKCFHSDFV